MAKILKDFLVRIDVEQDKLRKQRVLLEQAADYPQLFFDKASEAISRKDPLFKIMSVYEEGQRKMDSQELTEYIGTLLDKFFKEEMDDQNVSVKTTSSSSLYCVMMDDVQLAHFDPYEKFYGQRNYRTTKQLQDDFDNTLTRLNNETSEVNTKLTDMKKAKEATYKWIVQYYMQKDKGISRKLYLCAKDTLIYTFRMKQVNEGMDKKIKKYERQIEELKKRKDNHIECGTGIELLELRLQAADVISDVFKKYGYRHETENYKLY
ncbi:hypothetical protein IFU39_00175 [Paenibacillus sp. CFBP 13594]|uniref:hypothetical protein n=1 Tax=Paenibacillus sp. CFBP 13594 TaxID=2774037 RepID=UPI00177EA0BD|nr:hypothetical protein [Paenibacillus sp. CFBP 13594]MBD8836234.1 hypothetical protein [Paenibacillus sp. CFBP 13594]